MLLPQQLENLQNLPNLQNTILHKPNSSLLSYQQKKASISHHQLQINHHRSPSSPDIKRVFAPEPPAELDTQANPHYKIIHHACALLGHTIKEIDKGPESPEGEREKHELVKAIDQLNWIINKQGCGVADDVSLVNVLEPPTSNDPKLEKTAIETGIDQLKLKIDELLSRNSTETKKHASYASIAQGASSASSALYQPEVQLEKHQATDHTTRFVVKVSQPVPTAFNPLDLREAINKSLPTTCPARVVAIRRSHPVNLIFYASGHTAHLVSVSESWLYCLPFGEARINNENQLLFIIIIYH